MHQFSRTKAPAEIRLQKSAILALRDCKSLAGTAEAELASKLAVKLDSKCRAPSAASTADFNAYRKQLIPAICDFMVTTTITKTPANEVLSWQAVSIVPANERIAPKSMPFWSLTNFSRRMRRRINAISREALPAAIIGTDLSLNKDRRKKPKSLRFKTHYAPHLYGFFLTKDPEALKRKLRQLFPHDPVHAPRPVMMKPSDGQSYGISYAFKIEFYTRVTLTARKGGNLTRKAKLMRRKKPELVRVLLALANCKPTDRVIFIGCKMEVKGKKAKIVPRKRSEECAKLPVRNRPSKVYKPRKTKANMS